jgi:hypothetical protein
MPRALPESESESPPETEREHSDLSLHLPGSACITLSIGTIPTQICALQRLRSMYTLYIVPMTCTRPLACSSADLSYMEKRVGQKRKA